MNSVKKEKIKMYRSQGYGYEKISKLLDLNKSTVASHCKRYGLRQTVNKNKHKALKQNDEYQFCKNCGIELIKAKRGKPKKFCSEACRRSWWKENDHELNKKAYYTITCKKCNKIFESYGNKNRKYCSHECYILDVFTEKSEQIKAISKVISEILDEINNITTCKRASACIGYTGKILSGESTNKVVNKYSALIYELTNKKKEEEPLEKNSKKSRSKFNKA